MLVRSGLVVCVCIFLSGCQTGPTTAAERERAQGVLEETSPRNLDEHPKALPMLTYPLSSTSR